MNTSTKHMIRDCIIFALSMSGITFVYRNVLKRKGPLVRVIAFHDVADRTWFENVIDMLVRECTVITPGQFHTKEYSREKINVLVTFDDGYETWIDNCLPVLKKHNIKAIFFIISGLVDRAHDKESSDVFLKENLYLSSKRVLTWDGARTLVSEGHTIGGHTVSHKNLAKLSEDGILSEIKGDKEKLESNLGVTLADFAYPFGRREHYNDGVTKAVAATGYTRGYTAETGFALGSKNPLEIPRTLIENNQSLVSVKRWLSGAYDIFSKL